MSPAGDLVVLSAGRRCGLSLVLVMARSIRKAVVERF